MGKNGSQTYRVKETTSSKTCWQDPTVICVFESGSQRLTSALSNIFETGGLIEYGPHRRNLTS